jgi:hypothetical protein
MKVEDYHTSLDAEMTEEEHQIRLFHELNKLALNDARYNLPFHIPNGGVRHKATAGRLKAAGVKPGVPDIFIPIPRGHHFGMFIELKSLKRNARCSQKQTELIFELMKYGYLVEICCGWRVALQRIQEYLGGSYEKNGHKL